jgi:hypothetical protein
MTVISPGQAKTASPLRNCFRSVAATGVFFTAMTFAITDARCAMSVSLGTVVVLSNLMALAWLVERLAHLHALQFDAPTATSPEWRANEPPTSPKPRVIPKTALLAHVLAAKVVSLIVCVGAILRLQLVEPAYFLVGLSLLPLGVVADCLISRSTNPPFSC